MLQHAERSSRQDELGAFRARTLALVDKRRGAILRKILSGDLCV